MIKYAIALLALLMLPLLCFGQTNTANVTYYFYDFQLNPQSVRRVTQTPLKPLAAYTNAILTASPSVQITPVGGTSVTFSNVICGYAYRIQLDTPYGSTVRTTALPATLTGNVSGGQYLGNFQGQDFYYLYGTNNIFTTNLVTSFTTNITIVATGVFGVTNSVNPTNVAPNATHVLSNDRTTNFTTIGISSPGAMSQAEQYGSGANAFGVQSTAAGNGASASTQGTAVGFQSTAGVAATSVGLSQANGASSIAVGVATASGANDIAIGTGVNIMAAYTNSIGLGLLANPAAANQFILGPGISSVFQSNVTISTGGFFGTGSGITNVLDASHLAGSTRALGAVNYMSPSTGNNIFTDMQAATVSGTNEIGLAEDGSSVALWFAQGSKNGQTGTNAWGYTCQFLGGISYIGNPLWLDLPNGLNGNNQGFYWGFGTNASSIKAAFPSGTAGSGSSVQPILTVNQANPWAGISCVEFKAGCTNPARGNLAGTSADGIPIYMPRFGWTIGMIGDAYRPTTAAQGSESQQAGSYQMGLGDDVNIDAYVTWNGSRSGDTIPVGQVPMLVISPNAVTNGHFAHPLFRVPKQVVNAYMPTNPAWADSLLIDEGTGEAHFGGNMYGNAIGLTNAWAYMSNNLHVLVPEMFGAVPNTNVDSTAALQLCEGITEALNNQGLSFKSRYVGPYLISSAIPITNRFNIEGNAIIPGPGSTAPITPSIVFSGTNAFYLYTKNQVTFGSRFKDLAIVSSNYLFGGPIPVGSTAISLTATNSNSQSLMIQDCFIQGCDYSVSITNMDDPLINNLVVQNCTNGLIIETNKQGPGVVGQGGAIYNYQANCYGQSLHLNTFNGSIISCDIGGASATNKDTCWFQNCNVQMFAPNLEGQGIPAADTNHFTVHLDNSTANIFGGTILTGNRANAYTTNGGAVHFYQTVLGIDSGSGGYNGMSLVSDNNGQPDISTYYAQNTTGSVLTTNRLGFTTEMNQYLAKNIGAAYSFAGTSRSDGEFINTASGSTNFSTGLFCSQGTTSGNDMSLIGGNHWGGGLNKTFMFFHDTGDRNEVRLGINNQTAPGSTFRAPRAYLDVQGSTSLASGSSAALALLISTTNAAAASGPYFNVDTNGLVTIGASTNQISWGATNPVPASTNAILWIPVVYNGTRYTMPLMARP